MRLLARSVVELSDMHFRVLEAVEDEHERFGVVPVWVIASHTGLSEDYVSELLRDLHARRLLWAPRGRAHGYALNFDGLDALALRSLARRGIVTSIGSKIGVGKEADVYQALTSEGNVVALKFYRIGRASTKKHRRYRDEGLHRPSYLSASKTTAKREMEALRRLSMKGLDVPTPIYRNRHVIATSLIEGEELAKTSVLKSPRAVLRRIIENIKGAFEAGVIHCDLSAYNILVRRDESIIIIDWPQWVPPSHVMAKAYLERDVRNIVDFFRRRLHLQVTYMDPLIYELLGEVFEEGGGA